VFLNVFNRPSAAASPKLGPTRKNSLAIPWYTIVGNNDWKRLDNDKKAITDTYKEKINAIEQDNEKSQATKDSCIVNLNNEMYNEIFLGNRRRAAKQIQYTHKKHEEESSIW
jgi:hypothetical protein